MPERFYLSDIISRVILWYIDAGPAIPEDEGMEVGRDTGQVKTVSENG